MLHLILTFPFNMQQFFTAHFFLLFISWRDPAIFAFSLRDDVACSSSDNVHSICCSAVFWLACLLSFPQVFLRGQILIWEPCILPTFSSLLIAPSKPDLNCLSCSTFYCSNSTMSLELIIVILSIIVCFHYFHFNITGLKKSTWIFIHECLIVPPTCSFSLTDCSDDTSVPTWIP